MQTATATVDMPARTAPKAPPPPRNGVDTPNLLATIGAVAAQADLARFEFRARGRWIAGTHSRTTIDGFSGAGGEHHHKMAFTAEGDHPAVLCGADQGPTPVEWVLHALASCITAGIANIAAARGITLRRVECSVIGEIDLRGILGLSKEVRNGFERIRATFEIEGDATPEKLSAIVEQARARSAVFDMLANGVPVSVDVMPR